MGDEYGANAMLPTVDARPAAVSEPAADRAPMSVWVKISAGWWIEGAIDNDTFVRFVQFLVERGQLSLNQNDDDGRVIPGLWMYCANNLVPYRHTIGE